jgi:hypothetical protein
METKVCKQCKQEKFLSEFHKDIRTKDSLTSICKECKKKRYYHYSSKNISDESSSKNSDENSSKNNFDEIAQYEQRLIKCKEFSQKLIEQLELYKEKYYIAEDENKNLKKVIIKLQDQIEQLNCKENDVE